MAEGPPWKIVWITGASTGIGREIALQLAANGVKVAASARSETALRDMGSGITAFPLDVTDAAAVLKTAAAIEAMLGPIDLVIFGAGIYKPVSAVEMEPGIFAATMTANYMGVVNGLAAILPRMLARGRGHVSWIASVAGFVGLPKAAAYGPSKAALINLAECLQPELARAGVDVSVINPGFVATPMTAQNNFPMPFLMRPQDAARATIRGLKRKRFEIAYPWAFVTILKLARLLPYRLFFWLIGRAVLK